MVVRLRAEVREQQRGVDGAVELGEPADARRHQAAGVDGEHHRLAALRLEAARDRPAAPRGGLPVDVAVVVARLVVAQRLELACPRPA